MIKKAKYAEESDKLSDIKAKVAYMTSYSTSKEHIKIEASIGHSLAPFLPAVCYEKISLFVFEC